MSTEFWTLHASRDLKYCRLFDFDDQFPASYQPSSGMAMGADYPAGVEFKMAREIPGIVAADFIANAFGYTMVSQRGHDVLVQLCGAQVEMLPFTLVNKKGRKEKAPFWIANVLQRFDCADVGRSAGVPDPDEPGVFFEIHRLEIDAAKAPADRPIFRTTLFPRLLVANAQGAQALRAAALSGLELVPTGSKIRA